MELLSSKMTFYLKRIFPVFWFGFIVLFFVISATNGAWKADPVFFIMPVLMVIFGFFLFRALLWTLADEVRDGGSFLLVRKGSVEQRVPLSDIVNVSVSQFTNPQRVSLRLRTPGKLGDEIVFMPRQTMFRITPFARNQVAELLIKRVDAARLEAAR